MSKVTRRVLIGTESIPDLLRVGSALSTCDRGRVAAVLSVQDCNDREHFIIGYADSLTNGVTCDSHGHMMENDHCVRTIHAEQMAVAMAAKCGYSTLSGVCHVSKLPCESCLRVLSAAGVHVVRMYDKGVAETDKFKRRREYAACIGIDLLMYEKD